MKKIYLLVAVMLLASPLAALHADDDHHDGKKTRAESKSMADATGMDGEKCKDMQPQMKKMMQQMQEIRRTEDPDKRDKLMEEHMQTMQEGMKKMQGMGGAMMMKKGKMDRGAKGKADASGEDMPMRMQDMEQRMGMMQMMMDQMMQRQEQEQETSKIRKKQSGRGKMK